MSSTRVLTPSKDLNERNSQQRTLPWDRCKGNDYSGGMTNCGPEKIELTIECGPSYEFWGYRYSKVCDKTLNLLQFAESARYQHWL